MTKLHTLSLKRLNALHQAKSIKQKSILLSIADEEQVIDSKQFFLRSHQFLFEDCGKAGNKGITDSILKDIINYIELNKGVNNIYIQCDSGRSRSPAIAILTTALLNPSINCKIMLSAKNSCYESNVGPNEYILQKADALLGYNGKLFELAQLVFRKRRIYE